jgi:hypothetical protein
LRPFPRNTAAAAATFHFFFHLWKSLDITRDNGRSYIHTHTN